MDVSFGPALPRTPTGKLELSRVRSIAAGADVGLQVRRGAFPGAADEQRAGVGEDDRVVAGKRSVKIKPMGHL